LASLEEATATLGRPVDVLLEVNTSGEVSKNGFAPGAVTGLADTLNALKHVRIRGLMTMAAPENHPGKSPACFPLLRLLHGPLAGLLSQRHALEHLSMGMSNDFEIAIEEGATLVRIGTALFEGLTG